MCKTKGREFIIEVVCDQSFKMVDQDPHSPEVMVFMTKNEALFYEGVW